MTKIPPTNALYFVLDPSLQATEQTIRALVPLGPVSEMEAITQHDGPHLYKAFHCDNPSCTIEDITLAWYDKTGFLHGPKHVLGFPHCPSCDTVLSPGPLLIEVRLAPVTRPEMISAAQEGFAL